MFLGVIGRRTEHQTSGLDAFIDGFDIATKFPQGAEGVVADVPRLQPGRNVLDDVNNTVSFLRFSFAGAPIVNRRVNDHH